MILSGFVLGLSTLKVGEVLLVLPRAASQPGHGELGGSEPRRGGGGLPHPSAQRPQQALILDGVVLARKTGAGAFRRSVLVALVLRVGIPRRP